MSAEKYLKLLTIAGSDSGGGAGIQADLKTFSALGAYGMSVITAVTAQNTCEVRSIHDVDARVIRDQIEAVLDDIGADAVKIGMLHRVEVIETVAECLQRYQSQNLVLDPVMIAKSGDRLIKHDAVEALKRELFPLATVVTPNLPEAEVLVGRVLKSRSDMETAAREIRALGPQAVLIKGGHLEGGACPDLLLENESHWFESPRVQTRNTHGTGCTLSSAITTFLARGLSIAEAVRQSKEYLTRVLENGKKIQLGKGAGPVAVGFL